MPMLDRTVVGVDSDNAPTGSVSRDANIVDRADLNRRLTQVSTLVCGRIQMI